MQSTMDSQPRPLSDDSQVVYTNRKEYAEVLDAKDPLRSLRSEFIIPSKSDLKSERLFGQGAGLYLCSIILNQRIDRFP